ncbi:MAG: hypothetical protein ABIN89_30170 [Chitinophagaceae bacterium]
MKIIFLFIFDMAILSFANGQGVMPNDKQKKDLSSLIDKYSQAREKRDTVLLKNILTKDIDQLVSTGEWRTGIDASVKGMLVSSATSPGTRALIIDKIRLFNPDNAIVDCRYEIQNTDGTIRKMWSIL